MSCSIHVFAIIDGHLGGDAGFYGVRRDSAMNGLSSIHANTE